MTIELANIEFVNDFFSVALPDGSTMNINLVNEDFITSSNEECTVKAINIEVTDLDGNITSCPCVIGMSNDIMEIDTDYTEYEGEVLTPDNMAYCTITVYES